MIITYNKENLKNNIMTEMQLLDTTISNYAVKSRILARRLKNDASDSYNSFSHYNVEDYPSKLEYYTNSLKGLKNQLNELLDICKENLHDERIDDKLKNYNEQYKTIESSNLPFLLKLNKYVYSYIDMPEQVNVDVNADSNIKKVEVQADNNIGVNLTETQADQEQQTEQITQVLQTPITITPKEEKMLEAESKKVIAALEISDNSSNTQNNFEEDNLPKAFKVDLNMNKETTQVVQELSNLQENTNRQVEENQEIKNQDGQNVENLNTSEVENTNETMGLKDNNTLIISEIKGKVFLPYTIKELESVLDKSKKYNTIEEVVENKYILPLEKYKFANASRFKETFELMRKRQKASIVESLDIALEQTFNSSLNPAIISACKNLDELDIYLDCLDTDTTSKYPCFNIQYEMLPTKKLK
ncbi:MAG: hypothetical protein J6I85_01210 [Clostridia bacterium]|nr:hypothetical protein [Clostridia bacterium]